MVELDITKNKGNLAVPFTIYIYTIFALFETGFNDRNSGFAVQSHVG